VCALLCIAFGLYSIVPIHRKKQIKEWSDPYAGFWKRQE
jgi:hypothetical protein